MDQRAPISELPAATTAPTVAADLLSTQVPPGFYNEVYDEQGQPRSHWRLIHRWINDMGEREFSRRWAQSQRLVHENGIAYSAHADPDEKPRPWKLDPMPLLLPVAQWQQVAAGLQQRARLLNVVLTDLYGPQEMLRNGVLPPKVVFAHPGFMRPYHGQRHRLLNLYAADLARAPDGNWWVMADRSEAPSGAGFALENRIVVSRMLPKLFRDNQIERLAPYFIALQEMLWKMSPSRRGNPRIVVLSQGSNSKNYFEDSFLARYLGYSLVEADDLAVRGNKVVLKTLGGLLPIDAVLRRPNSELCDPMELSPTTSFGVSGLLQVARSRNVHIANGLGTGIVESPIFMAFMPRLCQALLGEKLLLPGVATWWCGEPKSLNYVIEHLDELTIKPAFRQRGVNNPIEHLQGKIKNSELAEKIRQSPENFVAQERVARSVAPVWNDGRCHSQHIAMRAFLVAAQDSYTVMQGGLVRVLSSDDPLELSLQSGEGSKDAWIVSGGPVSQVSLLDNAAQPISLRRSGADLPSRVADNLFWLGRYIERADAVARLMRAVGQRLTGESDTSDLIELPVLLRTLAEMGIIEPGFVIEGISQQMPSLDRALPESAFDSSQSGSMKTIIARLYMLASFVRSRISVDSWRIVHRIGEQFTATTNDLPAMLDAIDQLLLNLAALRGIVSESMTHSLGWRFLGIGRRVERALQVTSLLKHGLSDKGTVLEAILDIADSLMTYRSRYLANLQLGPVLDLLLTDETNPGSVAYQLAELVEHVDRLPRDNCQTTYADDQKLAMSALHTVRMLDLQTFKFRNGTIEVSSLLTNLEATLKELSDAISHKYFIHAGPPIQMAAIRPE